MPDWIPQLTRDGSYTFFSEEFGEAFHSYQGAKTEAFQKFSDAIDLQQRAKQSEIKLLDVCYGLGYNTAAAIEVIRKINPTCNIEIYGLELDPTVPIGAAPLLQHWSTDVQTVLESLAKQHSYQDNHLKAQLLIGDARQTIQQLNHFQADAIFFDPFSPRRCPQLWTVEFFKLVAQCLAPDGKLATYSRSASVRTALIEAGLQIGTIPLGELHLPHDWAQGTIAAWSAETLQPLSQMEQEHLNTRAAIPYRDRTLHDAAEEILERHEQEQRSSTVESTSSWRRRWNIK
ncbi:tRNA (5-methylaminomethyl-2-thiouridine)(34)-methyltransferase MnmD [Leptolyngbya sp. NIES-2104]|uniref:tRNA (5-methylaminomethyl-2-thiouridine)(34)-methyltransferase MnmD n=1 Tax=Leptolyngbya sp. NIES-2104 TaxID=1552121 RepID=UPI0006ECB44C|nr:MnmC family methyltransferase [Leptolyngbya sp. NIES-2104]GAP98787.1 SAM-dependent methyltransferase [Leptolyngbya sp. NIES-2104]